MAHHTLMHHMNEFQSFAYAIPSIPKTYWQEPLQLGTYQLIFNSSMYDHLVLIYLHGLNRQELQ
jgi:hypothetical protein